MKRVRGFGGGLLVTCTAAALAIAICGLASDAKAFQELIPTKIGLVKFGGSPAVGKLYKLVSKAPKTGPLFVLPTADPATTGGSLTAWLVGKGRLDCTLANQTFDGTEGWKTLGPTTSPKGYKYINKSAPGGTAGACKIVIVKEKVIKVIAKGTGTMAPPVNNPPGNPDIETVLTLGTDDYCAKATAPHFKEKENKLIKAKDEAAPLACPTLPVTTTTTTPSTTSTTGGPSTTSTSGTVPSTTSTSITVPSTTTTITIPPLPLDHYRLYDAAGLFIDPPPVDLVDQFLDERVNPEFASGFMVPVDKNLEGIIDPVSHLTCYPIQGAAFAASVDVSNQFGPPQTLSVGNPVVLCAPTEKLEPPTPGEVLRDHYKCYEASGDPPQMTPVVSLRDQFQLEETVPVLAPILFCNPADKNGEGIANSNDHLTCYLTDSPLAAAPGPVTVFNQFGLDTLNVLPPFALCVPSDKLDWTPVTTTTVQGTTTTTAGQTTTTTIATTTTSSPPTTTTTIPEPPPCEAAMAPLCDGWCPLGMECVEGLPGVCVCEQSVATCGDGQFGPPQCWGSCPPEAPICRDTGGICECTAF